jgi:hypothetical protein
MRRASPPFAALSRRKPMLARTALSMVVAIAGVRLATAAEPVAGAGTEAPASAAIPTPAAVPTTSGAPAVPEEPSLAQSRVLNGHVFMPSATVAGALTTTSFGTFLILGLGTTSASAQVGDKTYAGSFDYASTGAALAYEYAFMRYFSARFAMNDVIYSGIDGPSAIVVGTSLQFGASLGVTASLPIGDSLRVGVLFDAGTTPGLALTIGNGIKTIIDGCQAGSCPTGEGAIFGLHHATTLQPALAANWAPWRALGFTANVAYLSVSQTQGDQNFTGQAVSLAAAADLDFLAISQVPVGLQLAFSWTAPINGEELQHVTDLGGGIFYTGSQHLALGLQFVSRRFAVQPTVDVSWSTFLSTIGLRYYW